MLKYIPIYLSLLMVMPSCNSQTRNKTERQVGGPCEGCEATLEYDPETISAVDTIPGFDEFSPKIHIRGTVYELDGTSPAENVIVYLHQTNRQGLYPPDEGTVWASRHGRHRGWVKTGKDGRYSFYTFRPAAYPGTRSPQHIHIFIKEDGLTPYYIDDIKFFDDPLLTEAEISACQDRGGSGLVNLKEGEGMYTTTRDIILGMNIPGYPK